MEEQGFLMWGCWWDCQKALKTFNTIENTTKYYGTAMFINVGMLVELLESIETF